MTAAPTVGTAITEAEAAAVLVNVLGATRLNPDNVPGWTEEAGSASMLIAELVLRVRVLENALKERDSSNVEQGVPLARVQRVADVWGQWAGPAGPHAGDRERGYRAAAQQIVADLHPLIQEAS